MEDSIFFSTQLRTKRARKRSVKTTKEKNVREKYKRQKEIFKEQKEIPLVLLKEPCQKGFERYFVLREDIKKENEIEFFTQILKKINTSQYAETRKFVKKRKRNGKRIYVQRIQELKQLQPYEYSGPYSILNDEERLYFVCIQVYDPKTKRFKGIYEFLQPWRFRLIIKPNMITHYKPLDIDLKREEAQIDHFFDKYKNQLGNFYPPKEIFLDTNFLDTLKIRDIKSGLGEMAHYYLISNLNDWKFFKKNYQSRIYNNYQ